MPIVRTNIHRKKLADKAVSNVGALDPYTQMALGTGGKTGTGELRTPNGNSPNLFTEVKIVPITSFEKINDYEYIAHVRVDTSVHTDLIGLDINERAIVDSAGIKVVLETFAGYGPLQPNVTYDYSLRFTVV